MMKPLTISRKNLLDKPMTSLLGVILLAVSIGLITFLLNFNRQINEHFLKNIQGVDLVIGASGSPLQTMLSAVYFVDAPTGNINLDIYEKLKKHPLTKQVVPLAYGDNYRGFHIVGSDDSYRELYNLNLIAGEFANKPFDVVIGQHVAAQLNLKIGDSFHSAHGLNEKGDVHDHHAFTVCGILKRSNRVADNLIFCSIEDVWAVHSLIESDGTQSAPKQITALLVDLRNPMGMVVIPNLLRHDKGVQVVVPSVEIDRLFKLLGFGREALDGLAIVIFGLAGLSIFIAMYNAMNNRKYEVALMRSMGGTKSKMFLIVISEALFIGVAGIIVGFILGRIGLALMSAIMEKNYQYAIDYLYLMPSELMIIPVTFVLCIMAGLLPARRAMEMDIAKVLADEF